MAAVHIAGASSAAAIVMLGVRLLAPEIFKIAVEMIAEAIKNGLHKTGIRKRRDR